MYPRLHSRITCISQGIDQHAFSHSLYPHVRLLALSIHDNNANLFDSSIPAASVNSLAYGGFMNSTADYQQHLFPRQSQAHFVVTGVQGSGAPNRIEINDFVKQDDQFSLFIQALS